MIMTAAQVFQFLIIYKIFQYSHMIIINSIIMFFPLLSSIWHGSHIPTDNIESSVTRKHTSACGYRCFFSLCMAAAHHVLLTSSDIHVFFIPTIQIHIHTYNECIVVVVLIALLYIFFYQKAIFLCCCCLVCAGKKESPDVLIYAYMHYILTHFK